MWLGVALGVACLAGVVAVLIRSTAPSAGEPDQGLTRALVWFVLAYAGILLGNLLLLNSALPLDARILSPLMAALVPLAAALIVSAWQGRLASKALVAVLALSSC